jgi:hypothetical protein
MSRTPSLRCQTNRSVRFHFSEGIVRMALAFDLMNSSMERCSDLLSLIEAIAQSASAQEAERGFAAITLRVLVQQGASYLPKYFTPELLHRMAIVFLLVIRGPSSDNSSVAEKELFVQDICCSGLCQIFQLSNSLPAALTHSTHSIYASVSEKISSLVIATLCREKKALPSAGQIKCLNSTFSQYLCRHRCGRGSDRWAHS